MFTRNAALYFASYCFFNTNLFGTGVVRSIGGSDPAEYGVNKTYIPTLSAFESYMRSFPPEAYLVEQANNAASGVVFGNGSAPTTVDDYWLSGSYVSGLTNSNVSVVEENNVSENGISHTCVYTINNTNANDITIGEVALVYSVRAYKTTSTNKYFPIMFERTVLDNPVTIPAGGVGQVTYTITVPFPTP